MAAPRLTPPDPDDLIIVGMDEGWTMPPCWTYLLTENGIQWWWRHRDEEDWGL